MNITILPLLKDNYAYLLQTEDGTTAIVDPSATEPVERFLKEQGVEKLDYILNTHHHWDHTGGNEGLKKAYGAQIVGPAADAERIPGIDIALNEGDDFMLGSEKAEIFFTPGHTSGHISFFFPESKAVFTGDTLFSMGCGGMFEGTPETLWNSLSKLAALPDDTCVYCGHEYTVGNGEFGLTVEQDNQALKERLEEARRLHAEGQPTIPSTMKQERETNVFLRAGSAERLAEVKRMAGEKC